MDTNRKRQFEREAGAVRKGALAFFSSIDNMEARGVGHKAPGMSAAIAGHIPHIITAIRESRDQASILLLESIGMEAAIGIGVSIVASEAIRRPQLTKALATAAIARGLRAEMEAIQWWTEFPGRAEALTARAKDERMSKAKAARVWRRAATRIGFALKHWDAERAITASYIILMAAASTGLLRADTIPGPRGKQTIIDLSATVVDALHERRDALSALAVARTAMVCEPDPWDKGRHGGFLSQPAKDSLTLVSGSRHGLDDDMPAKFAAINGLQRTRLRIDRQVLAVVRDIIKNVGMHVISGHPGPHPPPFPWKIADISPRDRTPEQQDIIDQWKLDARDYHAALHGSCHKAAVARRCVADAVDLIDEPVIWQAWHCDLTGRFYPGNSGPSTMGSDLQKGLLQFADGLPIDTPEAEAFYRRAIAGLYGAKGTNAELEQWSRDHQPMILAIAANPLSCRQWLEADSPYQFLRQCFDFAGWVREGKAWLSRVPVELDGKTNGLQHIACMSRDEELARVTNLTEDPQEYDLYAEAASAMRIDIMHDPESKDWARHIATLPTDRKLGKKPVMGIPYGMRHMSAKEGFVKLIRDGHIPSIPRQHRRKAAAQTFPYLWQAAKKVTASAHPTMQTLREIAGSLLDQSGQTAMLSVTGPSGFVMRQRYSSTPIRVAKTKTFGQVRYIDWDAPKEDHPSGRRKHRSLFPPNAIHLCDAEVMTWVINAANHAGIRDLWMNHDSFGCHAAHAPTMSRLTRQGMVWLHRNHDPYGKWLAQAGIEIERGSFDLSRIIQSTYSFR